MTERRYSRYLLFYVDGPPDGRGFSWSWIDKWISMYDLNPIVIDPDEHYRVKKIPPYYFKRVEEAVEHPYLSTLTWVWTSEKADVYWDEVTLPKENVVYCTGSDWDGYYGYDDGKGLHVKLRPPHPKYDSGPENPWYASMVVPLLLFTVYGTVRER